MYSAEYSFSEMVQEEELNNNVFKAPSSIATPAASAEDGAERVDVNTSPEHNHIFARTKEAIQDFCWEILGEIGFDTYRQQTAKPFANLTVKIEDLLLCNDDT